MDNHFIHANNAFDAALFLLNFDKSSIKEHVQPDADTFINDLKIAFNQYQKSTNSYRRITTGLLDINIKQLLNAARNFYAILTDDAKLQLSQLLNQKISNSAAKKSA